MGGAEGAVNGFGRGLAGNPTALADGLDDRREKEGIGISPLGGGGGRMTGRCHFLRYRRLGEKLA